MTRRLLGGIAASLLVGASFVSTEVAGAAQPPVKQGYNCGTTSTTSVVFDGDTRVCGLSAGGKDVTETPTTVSGSCTNGVGASTQSLTTLTHSFTSGGTTFRASDATTQRTYVEDGKFVLRVNVGGNTGTATVNRTFRYIVTLV